MYNLANTEYELRSYPEAIEMYEKVLAQHKDDIECIYNLATSYYEINKLDESQRLFE